MLPAMQSDDSLEEKEVEETPTAEAKSYNIAIDVDGDFTFEWNEIEQSSFKWLNFTVNMKSEPSNY